MLWNNIVFPHHIFSQKSIFFPAKEAVLKKSMVLLHELLLYLINFIMILKALLFN